MVSGKMDAASTGSKSVMAAHRNSVATKCASFGFHWRVTPAECELSLTCFAFGTLCVFRRGIWAYLNR